MLCPDVGGGCVYLAKRHRNPSQQGPLLVNQPLRGAEVTVQVGREGSGKGLSSGLERSRKNPAWEEKGELEKPT